LWEYRRELPKIEGGCHNDLFDRARGTIALYDDKVLLATADAHIVALDARYRQGGLGHHRGRLSARLHVHEPAARRARQNRCRHQMGRIEGDFEKGSADGAKESLRVVS
jgi:hypothetical protein